MASSLYRLYLAVHHAVSRASMMGKACSGTTGARSVSSANRPRLPAPVALSGLRSVPYFYAAPAAEKKTIWDRDLVWRRTFIVNSRIDKADKGSVSRSEKIKKAR